MVLAPSPLNARIALGSIAHELNSGWRWQATAAGAAESPAELSEAEWRPVPVPGVVFDESLDHWYASDVVVPPGDGERFLCFDGLATLAEIFWDGERLLTARNMFRSFAARIADSPRPSHRLVIGFRSLGEALSKPPPRRIPRARFLTALVVARNLRHFRTSFWGRMTFTPQAPVTGPYRGVRLIETRGASVRRLRLAPRVTDDGPELELWASIELGGRPRLDGAELVVGAEGVAAVAMTGDGSRRDLHARLALPQAELWWPHTHGAQVLYPVTLNLRLGDEMLAIDCGKVGFRRVERVEEKGFGLRFNGEPIYCRGGAWTPPDPVSLGFDPARYRQSLELLRDAGVNMVRLTGNLLYEHPGFYSLCDELGILVFQDFMFANLDYPASDPEFMEEVRWEVTEKLDSWSAHCSIAVLCGGSEVYQQAAMMGNEWDSWKSPLFEEVLPALCRELCPELPYVANSPCAAGLPFWPRGGPSHYYGVGAYRRPLEDARLSGVFFASECLAFSNVPESLTELLPGEPDFEARYRAGVPRDRGADWDFGEVTDHYLERLFGVDAPTLLRDDPDRYFELARRTPGVMMSAVQGLWRDRRSGSGGALIWLLRDPLPGAGFGVLDHRGSPKAPYYYLKRIWARFAVWLIDDGLNGLSVVLANDGPVERTGTVRVTLLRTDGKALESGEKPQVIPARAQVRESVEQLLGHFVDVTHAYRFGAQQFHCVMAEWITDRGSSEMPLADSRRAAEHIEDFYYPSGHASAFEPKAALGATWMAPAEAALGVKITTEGLARSVRIVTDRGVPSDNYFDLVTGKSKVVGFSESPGSVTISALNAESTLVLRSGDLSTEGSASA